MRERWFRGYNYYWVVDQAEYATDLIFTSRESLAGSLRLLDHAINFSAKDILTFLGRHRFHPRFDGRYHQLSERSLAHARIKHRMKNNWLKMYDKFGPALRIETADNNPAEFRVRRWRIRKGRGEMAWCPMNKSVINPYRYREVALAANERYLDALSVVENPGAGLSAVENYQARGESWPELCGLQPGEQPGRQLFAAVGTATMWCVASATPTFGSAAWNDRRRRTVVAVLAVAVGCLLKTAVCVD